MKKVALVVSTLMLSWSALCQAEDKEILMPAIAVSVSDAKELREVNKLLKEEQLLQEKIMAKEGLKHVQPELPKYNVISDNSVRALLSQLDYTNLALKLGAPLPARPDLPSGTPFENNRFLHAYNNLILRSIAQHLGLSVPAKPDLSGKDNIEDQSYALVRENKDLLRSIGAKRGTTIR